MNEDLRPPDRFSFSDPNTAMRFGDLMTDFVGEQVQKKSSTDRYGYILDITHDGAEYPSALVEFFQALDFNGNPVSPQIVGETLSNPARASYAHVLTDDGFTIKARIAPGQIPLYRKAGYFDKANPSGSGVMIDDRGVYVNVEQDSNGVSRIIPGSFPWADLSGEEPVFTDPQVAPRVHISGTAGTYYVVTVLRGVTQTKLDVEVTKSELRETILELNQAKQDLETAKGDLIAAEADISDAKVDIQQALDDSNAALADAATARQEAQDALASAGGRNSRIISTLDASGTINPETSLPLVEGDTWIKVNNTTQRHAIAQWGWSGSAWVPEAITSDMVTNFDVHKLTVSGTAHIIQSVMERIIADAGHYGLLTADSLVAGSGNINTLVAQEFAAALASIIEARVENLTVTSGANIDSAVIQKIAAEVISSGEFRTLIDSTTGRYATMNSNGFQVIDSDGPTGTEGPSVIVNLGPSGDQLLQLGDPTTGMALIDSDGNISAPRGSFEEIWLDGLPIQQAMDSSPRGIVSWGQLFGGYSRQLRGRDQVIGLEADLAPGRVYRLYTSSAVVQTENAAVTPFLKLHYTLDGSYPGNNWGASARAESIIGPFGGFRTMPGMECFIDRREATASVFLRAGLSLGEFGNDGWAQVAAPVHRCIIAVEDMGTNFANRGTPYFDGAGGGLQPIRTRSVQRWYATGWATWVWGGSRDFTVSNPVQGQYSTINRESAFFFDDMTATLSGATIHRITLRTVARHWYGSSGNANWHWHNMFGSIPSSGQYQNYMVTYGGWPRGAARELNISPSDFGAWQSGARRGFGFATTSTDQKYYGYFSPNTGPSGDTWIEVDYEK